MTTKTETRATPFEIAVNNGSTILVQLLDEQGEQIAEIICLKGHTAEILTALRYFPMKEVET